jgi:hypothetical protein
VFSISEKTGESHWSSRRPARLRKPSTATERRKCIGVALLAMEVPETAGGRARKRKTSPAAITSNTKPAISQ